MLTQPRLTPEFFTGNHCLLRVQAKWETCWRQRVGHKFHPNAQIERAMRSLGAVPTSIIKETWDSTDEKWAVRKEDAEAVISLMSEQFSIYDIEVTHTYTPATLGEVAIIRGRPLDADEDPEEFINPTQTKGRP